MQDHDYARDNLLLVCRLVIRGLLEASTRTKHRAVSADDPRLLDLFVMVEKVLLHGLKNANFMLGLRTPQDRLWTILEKLGALGKEAGEAVNCIQLLPNVSSSTGRVRAWMRLALMQKKLADYVQLLIESSELVSSYYEPWAVISHETAGVCFCGSLIGLRVLDCNLYMKESDLIAQGSEINIANYVKIPTISLEGDEDGDNGENGKSAAENDQLDLKVILDQKHYLEERNKFLLLRLTSVQQQLELLRGMQKHNAGLDTVSTLTSSTSENINLSSIIHTDYKQLKSGEDSTATIDAKIQAQLAHLQEMEMAMELLEKDIHEKQDTIIMLRSQIDDIKKINLDLYQKLKSVEESSRQKDGLISKLEKSKEQYNVQIQERDLKIKNLENKLIKDVSFQENLQLELKKKSEFSAVIQQQLADAREEIVTLEETNASGKIELTELQTKVNALRACERAYLELQDKFSESQSLVNEYEKTLGEMGIHLERSKLTVDNLKESVVTMVDAQWEADKDAVACKGCERDFSVSRRRHHCRNCGGIYCGSCSENSMPLPSSAKPVRVCDACYQLLLKRYSIKSSTNSSLS